MPNWKDYVERDEDFFGREREIKAITENWNNVFAIAGAKRIGKTSLLKYLQRFWHQQAGSPLPIYSSMLMFESGTNNPRDAWLGMLSQNLIRSDPQQENSSITDTVSYNDFVDQLIRTLELQINSSSQHFQGIVFLIDEAQKLLDHADTISATVQTLREVEEELRHSIGIVFAGLRGIHDFKEAYGSRLCDKATLIRLGPLEEPAARHMAGRLFDESHIDEINDFCGGHPFLTRALKAKEAETPEQMKVMFLNNSDATALQDWWNGSFGLNEQERVVYRELVSIDSQWNQELSSTTITDLCPMSENVAMGVLRALYTHGFIKSETADGRYRMGASLLKDFVDSEEITQIAQKSFSSIKVFVSYSHADAIFVKDDKVSLLCFVRGLERYGVTFWWDHKLNAGDLWDAEIKTQLRQADIALVLVSQPFLNSSYCQDVEARSFIESQISRGLRIIPIILSACDWERHKWLKQPAVLPGEGQNIKRNYSDSGKRQELFLKIYKAIEKACCIKD